MPGAGEGRLRMRRCRWSAGEGERAGMGDLVPGSERSAKMHARGVPGERRRAMRPAVAIAGLDDGAGSMLAGGPCTVESLPTGINAP